jgi:hypothetical protein
MKNYDLSKTYEFEGNWWIAGTNNKFPGKLSLTPQSIELKVYGLRDDLVSWTGYNDKDKPRIIGKSIDGVTYLTDVKRFKGC